jgi:hypothetical protein
LDVAQVESYIRIGSEETAQGVAGEFVGAEVTLTEVQVAFIVEAYGAEVTKANGITLWQAFSIQ